MTPVRENVAPTARETPASDAFLSCEDCGEVHRVTAADRAPAHTPDGNEIPCDDLADFQVRHRGHPLRWLHRSGDAELRTHALHDPACRVIWQLVDDVGRRYVVESSRENAMEARRYRIRPGRLVLTEESIELDAVLFRTLVEESLAPGFAPERKLAEMTSLCERRLLLLPREAFEVVAEDASDPAVLLACLPPRAALALDAAARLLFPGPGADRLGDLFSRELPFEIPVVRIRRHWEIREA